MWILVDCSAVLDGIRARGRSWKRFQQYAKIYSDLAAELDRLLLLLQEATGTHFVKVRSHRSDPLNEEADSVAEQATAADRVTDPNLYPHLATARVDGEHRLFQHVKKSAMEKCGQQFAAAEQNRKQVALIRIIANGNQPDRALRTIGGLNFTESFLQYEDVGREFLGVFLSGPRTEIQRNLIQSISSTFQTNCFYINDCTSTPRVTVHAEPQKQ